MGYKTYNEYKDSGIEWIGEIPSDWNVFKLKHVVNEFITGGTPKSSNDDFWDENNEGIPWIAISDMTDNDFINAAAKSLTEEGLTSKNLRILKKGTLIYSIFASLGKVSILNIPATTNQAILGLITSNKINKFYLKYYLEALREHIISFSNVNTQDNLNSTTVKNIDIILPPKIDNQNFIVNFLDKKTSEIDEDIAKNKELINLLEEKKAAFINQAVTKGLGANVPMKDSGIGWFDEIPNHWVTVKAKRFAKIETGGTPKRENLSYWENGTINWITSGEVNQEVINDSINKISVDGLKNSNAHLLPINSVVMALSGQGQTKGRVAVLNISTCCSQSVGAFICDNKNIFYKFLFYYLKSRYSDIRGLVGDNLRDGLSLSIIGNIPILMPPYEEQKNISKFLDREIPKIDESIKKIQENINLLEEYKSSLIHHVVTGKIDVREEEI